MDTVEKVKRAGIKMKKSTETFSIIYETFRKKDTENIWKKGENYTGIQHLLILLKCRFVPKGIHELKASMSTSAG